MNALGKIIKKIKDGFAEKETFGGMIIKIGLKISDVKML